MPQYENAQIRKAVTYYILHSALLRDNSFKKMAYSGNKIVRKKTAREVQENTGGE